MQYLIMAGFLENIVGSIFIISTIYSHAGAEYFELECENRTSPERYPSTTPANECEQLYFHGVTTTVAKVCQKLSATGASQSVICHDEPDEINQPYDDRGFTRINKLFIGTFNITVNESTKLWEIEINCDTSTNMYGNITCSGKRANLTIWIAVLDQRLREIISRKIEKSILINTTNITLVNDTRERDNTNQVSFNENITTSTGIIIGTIILGFGIIAIVTVFHKGSHIQQSLKTWWYRMSLKFPFKIGAYYYMECRKMRSVEMTYMAKNILNVARFEDDILIVSDQEAFIHRLPYSNFSKKCWWNEILSFFCCKPNTLDDHAANIPIDIDSPWSMAVDSLNKCAFVSGFQNVICRIPLVTGPDVVTFIKWPVFTDQKVETLQVSLSMENNGHIIAASREVYYLEEYNSDGKLVETIKLKTAENYKNIQHAIKRADGKFVLVHGWKQDKYHRACLVDIDGTLLESYGNFKGNADGDKGQLDTPTHLAVDKNNFVLVSDYNNHRIILLDPCLKFVTVLIPPNAGLHRPGRLFLDEREENQLISLFVGEDRKNTKARIVEFSLTRREASNNLPESEPLNTIDTSTLN